MQTDNAYGRYGCVCDFLNKFNRFAIFTHLTPDGDAFGSSYALCALLRALGKQAVSVFLEDPPGRYDFPEFKQYLVRLADLDMATIDACVAVDCAAKKRLSSASEVFFLRPSLSIDHHTSNERFADVNYTELLPATSEIIFELFEAYNQELPAAAKIAVYMGIATDTGNLSYSSTTARTFEICARLSASGLDTSAVAERIFNTRSYAATKLIGLFIRNIKLFDNGRIAVSHIAGNTIKQIGANATDTESLINFARDIETVSVAAFFREIGKNKFKLSLRSKGQINVALFAEEFGGGGHERAAGCVVHGDRDEIEKDLVERLERLLV